MSDQDKRQPKSLMWKQTGGGSFYLARLHGLKAGTKEIIKPNQVFEATEDEIPRAFRDTVKPVDPGAVERAKAPVVKPTSAEYEVRSRGPGWYDVVRVHDSHKMNDKGLRQDEARKLIDSLS